MIELWTHVEEKGDCWVWMAGKDKDGYGQLTVNKKKIKPHRLAYELVFGRIPTGLEIDHLCRVRPCLNPFHLEATTHATNNARGISPTAINARKTHCVNGHPLKGANLYIWKRNRACRICKNAHWRGMYHRRKSSGAS